MAARVLAVDFGSKRIGLAISDGLGVTAQPLEVVADIEAVIERARDHEVAEIVVGLPIRTDGTHGPEADAAEAFARDLEERVGIPVTLWDERLSSVEAERVMRDQGVDSRGRRGSVDKVAAAIFLQTYLESKRR